MHAEQFRHEMELKLEQERHENARLREQAAMASAAVLKSELAVALQSRLEKLHVMQLLKEDELYALEDIIADGADEVDEVDGEDRVAQMVALSSRMHGDGAFARQMRRKFLG